MNYEKRFAAAVTKTLELGLLLPDDLQPFQKALSHEEKRQALNLCVEILRDHGFKTSKDLAGHCVQTHQMMRFFFQEKLGLQSYITIGDIYSDDYTYCEMNYESIKNEILKPEYSKPLKAHVWLTLQDGTIIDCTAQAHDDLLRELGNYPIHECLRIVEIDTPDDKTNNYYRPYLIGSDYLRRTGTIA